MKCALFTLPMTAMYLLLIFLFQLEAVAEEFAGYSGFMFAALVLLGNAAFLMQDVLLQRMSALYVRRRRR